VLLLLPLPTLSQDAPMFRANLEHTGVYSGAGVPKLGQMEIPNWRARDFFSGG
jgi:hypothetical protein